MIKFGTDSIGAVYLGTNKIGKAYLGSNLVYQSGSAPVIPDGPVDWIQSDGVAYINSGITRQAPIGFRAKALYTGDGALFGSRKDNNDTRLIVGYVSSQKISYGYYYVYNGESISSSITNKTPVLLEGYFASGVQKNRHKQYGDASYTLKSGTSSGNINTEKSNYILAYNYNGTAIKATSGTRLYYLKIYSDHGLSTLLFDGVPYKYNGEYGLWDNVSNAFFGNAASSGKFKGGIDSFNYTQVDYIQTDGTAFIDTGITGNDPRSVEMKFTPAGTSNALQVLLGTTTGSEDTSLYCPAYITTGGAVGIGHRYYFISGAPSISDSITNGTPVVMKAAYAQGTQALEVKQQGESSFTTFSKTNNDNLQTWNPMYLFAAYNPSSDGAVRNCLSGTRIHYCKIYSGTGYSDLIFDGIPVLYNNEYGLWDKVTNTFFGNIAGSGAFTGPSNA